ncbi:MAG: TIGR00730 family Rossman fold protein [Bacteroidales bacterium]|jgi:uncharacterized protein (TIGR00730 family)|nr:TIGR00730 family Rossman fold protein [Bacteroidales bacterium]
MKKIRYIAVFCGSRVGKEPLYEAHAKELGTLLAQSGISLVYGAGGIGLMNAVAEGCLQNGGHAIGVLPTFFDTDAVARNDLSELILTATMSERKNKIMELSDAFIALPGGYGTLDELFEVLTFSQLSLHQKPVAILNTLDFYAPMLSQLQIMENEDFLFDVHHKMLIVENSPQKVLEKIQSFDYQQNTQWVEKVKMKRMEN